MEMQVHVPDGQCGAYKVETFEVSADQAAIFNIRAAFSFSGGTINPGTYKRLMRDRTVVMSNTPEEVISNRDAYRRARGRVLINGLGLGMLLQAILGKPGNAVSEVWVVEAAPEVVALVGPTYAKDPRVKVIEANALEYTPPKGVHFDFVWHDIWDYICADNLPEMHRLHRKYGRCCDEQASWERELCERHAR